MVGRISTKRWQEHVCKLSLLLLCSTICVSAVEALTENSTGPSSVDGTKFANEFPNGSGDKSCSSEDQAKSAGGKAALLISMFETFKSHPLGYFGFVFMLTGKYVSRMLLSLWGSTSVELRLSVTAEWNIIRLVHRMLLLYCCATPWNAPIIEGSKVLFFVHLRVACIELLALRSWNLVVSRSWLTTPLKYIMIPKHRNLVAGNARDAN